MSALASLLAVDEQARLTGVGIRPLAREMTAAYGTTHLHLMVLPAGSDATAVAGAVTTFLPAAVATLSGTQPDGSTWLATFQVAVHAPDTLQTARTAHAAMMRALTLTAVDGHTMQSVPVHAIDVRNAYDGAGDVSGWSLSNLLVGLFIELTGTDLVDVVAHGNGVATDGADAASHRHDRLCAFLTEWSVEPGGWAA